MMGCPVAEGVGFNLMLSFEHSIEWRTLNPKCLVMHSINGEFQASKLQSLHLENVPSPLIMFWSSLWSASSFVARARIAKMSPKRLKWTLPSLMDIVLLMAIALSCLPEGQCAKNPGVTILSDTGSDILVHCKSADNDIGLKTLPYGKMLHWSFRPNIGLSTLYWCNFAWKNPASGQTLYATFDVWSSRIIRGYLTDSAAWKAKEDGFYIYVSTTLTWEMWEVWSPNRKMSFANENLN